MTKRVNGNCKLTGEVGAQIDCHIFPRSFLGVEQKRGEVPLKVYPLHKQGRPKASQTGIYDREIVGEKGERILARLDTAANQLLNTPIPRNAYLKDGRGFIARDDAEKKLAYLIDAKFYSVLKLFVLSVFWRASVSNRPELEGFKLSDEVEVRARDLIVSDNPSSADELSVLIVRYTNDLGVPLVTPNRLKIKGLPFVQAAFGSHHIYMKTSADPTSDPIDEMQLNPSRPLPILLGDFFVTGFGQRVRDKFRKLYSNDEA